MCQLYYQTQLLDFPAMLSAGAHTNTENSVLSLMMIDDLINEVSIKYPEAKAIFSLLMEDPQISNALKQVDLKKGKSQAYDYVKKMQSYAKELYNKNYR